MADQVQELKRLSKMLNHRRKELENLRKGLEKKAREVSELERQEQQIRSTLGMKIFQE